ncbi:uncharacterized protein LOC131616248 [Vicia villosa]|uniref:uncharacterized protein LOC131616248 n=1 Tax=Vicia villosa TaxID=3911 RepID=UPI00273CB220|nr:uncharacterized protein LOC131616248 [Vicia villosa]
MAIDDEQSKSLFKQLLAYFIVDQILLCSSNPKVLRSSSWGAVADMEAFEKINWAKAVFEHICKALKELKELIPNPGQHTFKACGNILETILYNRISSIQPQIMSDHPLQKYRPKRFDAASIEEKLNKLKLSEIIHCKCCEGDALEGDADDALEGVTCSVEDPP